MRFACVALVGLVACGLSACADPNTTPVQFQFGTSKTLITSGSVRMVTERDRPIPGDGVLPTVCTEPSPDVAMAFAHSASVSGNFSEPNGPTVGGSGSASLNETATELGGRTAGVLALRDGLFAACQAYVNGVIGHDAYAIILSNYGNLLVALAGSGTATQTNYTAQEAATTAMLVTCISEYDPTRLAVARNPLITPRGCAMLLNKLANGTLLKPVKVATTTPTPKAPAAPGAAKKVVTPPASPPAAAPPPAVK